MSTKVYCDMCDLLCSADRYKMRLESVAYRSKFDSYDLCLSCYENLKGELDEQDE